MKTRDCTRCNRRWNHHTGLYCEHCGEQKPIELAKVQRNNKKTKPYNRRKLAKPELHQWGSPEWYEIKTAKRKSNDDE